MSTPGFSFAVRTDGGPDLGPGPIADGEILVRSGETLTGRVLIARVAAASGAAGPDITLQRLTVQSIEIDKTTPTPVMTTVGLSAGVYRASYALIYQSSAATTGIGLAVNYTGTLALYSMMTSYVASTATEVADGVSTGVPTTGLAGKSERAKNTVSSATGGVDTADSNCMVTIDVIIEVTGPGDLVLMVSSGTFGTAVRVMAGSCLQLTRY